MLLASINFRAQPHKRAELLDAVDDVLERMRQASGCGRCRLLVDADDPYSFTVASEWELGRDADAFFESREFRIFRGFRILLRDEPVLVRDEVASRVTSLIRGR
jgi:quinol monooxygenase YgiN